MLTKTIRKSLLIYILLTAFCGAFSYVYESFSHEVYSDYMAWLFLIPLLLGVIPNILALISKKLFFVSSWQRIIHNFAIATLTVGSILQGVVQIYGTSSPYIIYYFIVGIAFLALSILIWIANKALAK